MSDEELSQRDRRRQQNKSSKSKVSLPRANLKQWAMPAIFMLLVGGVVTAMVLTSVSAEECPGHWHSTFNVYVDDERISYDHAQYDLGQQTPLSYHLHQPNDALIHFEPPRTECIPMETFLSAVDTTIGEGIISFDGNHASLGQAGTYENDGNRTLQFFIAPTGDDWEIIGADELNERQSLDGERMLILFGNYTDERIAQLQGGVPYPPGPA
jgi:hypothetical protein